MNCKTCYVRITKQEEIDNKGHCDECWDEIKYGMLAFSNKRTLGGSEHYDMEDESPSQSNAIRILEDYGNDN